MNVFVDFGLEVLTPAFVSGADQKLAELRSATVRGLLRWWWRALVGHDLSLPELRREETRIFGSTEEGLKSRVSVMVKEGNLQYLERGSEPPQSSFQYRWEARGRSGASDILTYLAYGPVRLLKRDEKMGNSAKDPIFNDPRGRAKRGPQLHRQALKPGSTFTVRLSWRRETLSPKRIEQLIRAACSWVTLGGIGSRSRKGWGALEGDVAEAETPELMMAARGWWKAQREELLRQERHPVCSSRLPDFPQLANRVVRLGNQSFPGWEDALGSVGLFYREFRLALRERGLGKWATGELVYAGLYRRRASSLLVSVFRGRDRRLRGLLCLLPCSKHPEDPAGDMMKDLAIRLNRVSRE